MSSRRKNPEWVSQQIGMKDPTPRLCGAMRNPAIARIGVATLAMALVVSACSASPAPTTTAAPTTTIDVAAAELESDRQLIHDLWWGQTLAFNEGFDEGVGYWVENTYPQLGCTYGDYLSSWFPEGPVDGYAEDHIANGPTIVRDDGWVIPGGRLRGQVADGRVYVMSVTVTTIDPRTQPEPAVVRDLHATILDGKAYFFKGCST